MAYFTELYTGTRSLFIGLGVTIKEFFKPWVTMQYPHEHIEMTPLYRGHIELVKNEETGKSTPLAELERIFNISDQNLSSEIDKRVLPLCCGN